MSHTRCSLVILPIVLFFLSPFVSAQHFYVAQNGRDTWSGTLAAPNRLQTDGPFATLGRAIEKLNEEGRRNGSGKTRHARAKTVVEVRSGVYELRTALRIKDLSHCRVHPYRNEHVTLTGSTSIMHWKKLSDPDMQMCVRENLRDSIVEIDLKENGITNAGEIKQRGGPALQLFIDGARQELVRYPRTGWLHIADVPQSGDSLYNKGLEREKRFNNVPVGRHYGRIQYGEDRISTWSARNELFMQGYWTWDWSDSFQKIDSIIADRHELAIGTPHHWYGYTKNQRYCFYNMLEELSAPGQWCINRAQGRLYVYPLSPIKDAPHAMRVSMLEDPLIIFENCTDVALEGFTLTQSRGSGVVVNGGSGVTIERCTMTDLGNCAVVLEGGSHNGVRSCDMHDLALSAVDLAGGDRPTLTPGGNFCDDNHIHHFSLWLRTGQYAVRLSGVGNRVAHNLIHDAPFEAIYLSGNDHVVEYNEVHDVTQETGDAGALHTGRDWTWRGNQIRYNYFHHLQGPGLHGVMGVYLDDWASGFTVKGNIFYKAGRATMIGGGRDNVVENNIYVECAPSIHVDARGLGWAGYYFDGSETDLFKKMDAMKYLEPPYSTRYPELLTLYKDDPALPKHNVIRTNISYGGRWMDVYDYRAFDFSMVAVRNNVIADTAVMRRRRAGEPGWDPYYLNIDMKEGNERLTSDDSSIVREFKGNTFYRGDPGFMDLAKEDFRLKKNSPALKTGFRQIPVGKIGLIRNGR